MPKYTFFLDYSTKIYTKYCPVIGFIILIFGSSEIQTTFW